MSDFMQFSTKPDDWGIFKVLERIQAITQRFAPPIPQTKDADFKNELKSQLYQPGDDQSEMIPAGALPKQDGMPTVEKAPPLEDLFLESDQLRQSLNPGAKQDYTQLIQNAAAKYNLDPNLIKAVIQQESNFNPSAISNKGAMGLMQLMPGTADNLGVSNPLNPEENVDAGAKYLRQMIDRFGGDKEKALAAYNAGPGAVESYGGVPPYKETKNYVNNILQMLGGKQQQ